MTKAQAAPPLPQTTEELMLQALDIEREAVARYEELADMMQAHNNAEVAELFRRMALVESQHVVQILAEMGWAEDMPAARHAGVWAGDGPETVSFDDMHYLMHPWHALHAALGAEQRAEAFFAAMAAQAPNEIVRRAAAEMRDEEAEHVRLMQAWIEKVPRPGPEWAVDPDPPRHAD